MNDSRYIRQILLDKIGESGQRKLNNAHVAIVGCGGLGSIAGPYLAGAGVGKLTLIDGDVPDLSNLHRQVFYKDDQSKSKSEFLEEHLGQLNPTVVVQSHSVMISKANISSMLTGVDVVLECTDNIKVKYLVNDYCHLNRLPMVYGAIHKYDGFVSFFENKYSRSIHLRDIFPEPNFDIPSCSEVGVMGTLAGLIGMLQANEAIKYISLVGSSLSNVLLSYDILTNDQMKLKLKKSWSGNIEEVYNHNEYAESFNCEFKEITIQELQENRSAYELISILEDHEHRSIDSKIKRSPLSCFDVENWKPDSDKVHVFYCMSGKRSGDLVAKIKARYPKSELLSLKGGFRSLD